MLFNLFTFFYFLIVVFFLYWFVFYRDFSNLKLDYNEYFSDLSHLNSNGMRLFTKTFIVYFNNS